ncbi:MAG: short-chain dehydrogenase [Acidobacteria bacterium]|nr:MAG: short-chain dehydrogenase [Acidobacteriota bacterium]
MRLQGKTAIITGAGSGIGEASAKIFTAEGAHVAVVDRDVEGGTRVAQEVGGPAFFLCADVASPGDMEAMARTVAERFGRIDILFNNAGVSCVGALHETSEQEWDRVMTVNAKGVFLASRCVVPMMIAQRSGNIINMASGASIMGLAQRAAYSASKGAVYALTRAMQADYCRYGIRVNALVPGTIYTPFVEGYLRRHYADNIEKAAEDLKKRQLSGTLGTPEDVGYAALYLASDEAKFVYGSALVVDGGFSAGKIFD